MQQQPEIFPSVMQSIRFGTDKSLAEEIVSAWLPHAQNPDESWQAHQDINDVMFATALMPETFLSIDERDSASG